jgi:dipeptidyl aminopeptidase/acylaminoacyl peptidase
VLRYCYVAHVRICESADPKINGHLQGARKFFDDNANVDVLDASDDDATLLLYVDGPSDPPAYYQYRSTTREVNLVGIVQEATGKKRLPTASIVEYAARDGLRISGYLTRPPGATDATGLPLVVLPHGGPEARDHLTFDVHVQFFAARGYAVFQPNYRGSSGFGRDYIERGYGEWGRKMQDDIGDGLKTLVDQGEADPARVCIVGASYGGYAALAGATLTPDLYKCAVSIAGISDLDDFIGWRKRNWGSDSEGYTYWLKAIGDPDKDEARLREVSPLTQVAKVKIPILLIHGTDDQTVPFAQSKAMKKALDKSGRKTELIALEKEDHSYWSDSNEKLALSSIDSFLWQHLGPGFGITTPPAAGAKAK